MRMFCGSRGVVRGWIGRKIIHFKQHYFRAIRTIFRNDQRAQYMSFRRPQNGLLLCVLV